MPTDQEEKIREVDLESVDEKKVEPVELTDKEKLSEAESHITDQAADLRAQLRHALESLPGMSEDHDTVRELEEIKAELARIENSFLGRVGKFLSAPIETVKNWQEQKRQQELSVTDNPKIIRELENRVKKMIKQYSQRKHSDPKSFPLAEIQSIHAISIQAQRENTTLWRQVDKPIRDILNQQIMDLLGSHGLHRISIETDEKVREHMLDQVLLLWQASPDQNVETAKMIEKAIQIHFRKKEEVLLYSESKQSAKRLITEQKNAFLKQYPDIYAITVIDLNTPAPHQRKGSYDEQVEVLKRLRDIPQRNAVVAEFVLEDYSSEGLNPDYIDDQTRVQLFEAYYQWNPKEIINHADVFYKEIGALPAKKKIELIKRVFAAVGRGCLPLSDKFLSYVSITSDEYEILKDNLALQLYNSHEQIEAAMAANRADYPFSTLLNGELWGVTPEEKREFFENQKVSQDSSRSNLHTYRTRIQFFESILLYKEKFPEFTKEEVENALREWCLLFLEQIKALVVDPGLVVNPEYENKKIEFFSPILASPAISKETKEFLRREYAKSCLFFEPIVRQFKNTYEGYHQHGYSRRTKKTTGEVAFFKEFFGIEIDKNSEASFKELLQGFLKLENPKFWFQLHLSLRSYEDSFASPKECSDIRKEIIEKMLATGDTAVAQMIMNQIKVGNEYSLQLGPGHFERICKMILPTTDEASVNIIYKSTQSAGYNGHTWMHCTFSSQEQQILKKRIAEVGSSALLMDILGGLGHQNQNVEFSREDDSLFVRSLLERGTAENLLIILRSTYGKNKVDNELIPQIVQRIIDSQEVSVVEILLDTSFSDTRLTEYRQKIADALVPICTDGMAARLIFWHQEAGVIELTPDQEQTCLARYIGQSNNLEIVSSEKQPEDHLSIKHRVNNYTESEFLFKTGGKESCEIYVNKFKSALQEAIENPEQPFDWSLCYRMPTDVALKMRESLLRRMTLLEEQGGKVIADIIKKHLNTDRDFDFAWAQVGEIAKHIKKAEEVTGAKENFRILSPQDKIRSILSMIGAQEALANKNLRLRLFHIFEQSPLACSAEILKSFPEATYPVLHLLANSFNFSVKEAQEFSGHMFSGQVLKKQTDKDRFLYFLVEMHEKIDQDKITREGIQANDIRNFVNRSTPLMEAVPECKKKVFEMSQLLRSCSFLQGSFFRQGLTLMNNKLLEVHQNYGNFLNAKKQEWSEPLQAEIVALSAELQTVQDDEKQYKKVEQKIRKKQSQIARGPEGRDLAEHKKQAAQVLQQQLEQVVNEFSDLVPKLFAEKCGVELSKEEVNRFLERFKNPQLVVVYLAKLEAYPHQRALFQKFIEAVAKGNLSHVRYEHREHLDKVFNGDARLEKLWKMDSRLSHKGEVTDTSENSEMMVKQRVKEFITEAIRHSHVEGEFKEVMEQYLESTDIERAKIRKVWQDKVAAFEKEKNLSASEKTAVALYNTMKLLSLKVEQFKEGIIKEKTSTGMQEKKISELLAEIKAAFTEGSQFLQDVSDMETVIGELQKEKPAVQNTTAGLYAEETEDPDLMLRMGTDVVGSCQNVNGTPSLNRNLISYLMDGKVKTVVVRDAAGDIVSRAIMRILYDEEAEKPVINMEHSYHRSDASVQTSNELLFRLAQEKATKMGIDLVVSAKFRPNQILPPYDGQLVSYGGPGDTEYVDTIGGSHVNQKYTIPGEKVYWVSLKNTKENLELDSTPNYDWQSNAA